MHKSIVEELNHLKKNISESQKEITKIRSLSKDFPNLKFHNGIYYSVDANAICEDYETIWPFCIKPFVKLNLERCIRILLSLTSVR